MGVTIVVAVGENGVIGRDGGMPWPRTGDMRQFKEITWGHPMVMGRATYEAIGRPLPGRTSIVLTRRGDWDPGDPSVIVAADLDTALTRAAEIDDQVFLVGGATVYDEALERGLVDELVVTHVPLSPEGDAFFGPVDPEVWRETEREAHAGTPDYEIATYVRR
ncbi:dihydrofolate reductase [Aeromicrobium sp. 636]|uniref:Dihydrofolate reductase n=1 Tax=Aeromicrobium senzhongii TaxID=2663859 RepID=A0A8I0ESU6_9ACTN|nr:MULTISPECIES: dihydrofolate reductase [Aeromicrobium]MBC9224786.1 dihydrofolate reductase [Aeromicrobium senzhongii]MCQ3996899.1 dihydrofolate reductase [Aeromicrobium sp. 636]MTB86833.1 dihydrofolate reductase [Aeromicrobium senzhongii]QNL93328.1 dihydrofolate reductase [Aeromicrobium senzhongii]